MQYCNGVRDMIRSLKKFILINGMKQKFKWNSSGVALSAFAPSAAPAAAKEEPKKEEPKKEEPKKEEPKAAPANDAMDMGALFAELNKGGAITKGMKKVTDDMKVYVIIFESDRSCQ